MEKDQRHDPAEKVPHIAAAQSKLPVKHRAAISLWGTPAGLHSSPHFFLYHFFPIVDYSILALPINTTQHMQKYTLHNRGKIILGLIVIALITVLFIPTEMSRREDKI
jgi:hypothetical protein